MNEHHNEILKCMKVTKRSLTIIEAITCVSSVSQSVRVSVMLVLPSEPKEEKEVERNKL